MKTKQVTLDYFKEYKPTVDAILRRVSSK